jgi:hypothetical protein
MALRDEMRQFIKEFGLSQNQIAKKAQIRQGFLSMFLSGQVDMTGEAMETICEHLNLKLVKRSDINVPRIDRVDTIKPVVGRPDIIIAEKPAPDISNCPARVESLDTFLGWLYGNKIGLDHLLCLLTTMTNVQYFP